MGLPAKKQRSLKLSQADQLREARAIIREESAALGELAERLDTEFCTVVEAIHQCSGKVVVTGVGKAGLIGQKIAATLSSTGTPAHCLDATDAVHGDLGCLASNDILLALSNSGETAELCDWLPRVSRMNVPIVGMTANANSTLGKLSDVVLLLGKVPEAGSFGLAPTSSTTAMLALGDALALVLSQLKGFTSRNFAIFHPGGSLGRMLTPVADIMRGGDQIRTASESETVRSVFATLRTPGRRTGAVILLDEEQKLTGIFTDSDLARLLERRQEDQLDRPISEVMTSNPVCIELNATLGDAVAILSEKKVSELPVVDQDRKPIGLIDITDVIGLMPHDERAA
jgi:arabinose-5-phosphate isomerase